MRQNIVLNTLCPYFAMPTLTPSVPYARERRQFLLALAAAAMLSPQTGRSEAPLIFGVVPYLTARRLAQLYEPIRAEIANILGQPVALESAPDYPLHFARTASGHYALIATSPYFGLIAKERHGFVGLAQPSAPLEPLLIVAPDSPFQQLSDLRGQKVATSDAWANLTLTARQTFRALGWRIGNEIKLIATGSHANSFAHLDHGQVAAAVVSVTTLKQLNVPADRYRILYRFPPSPGLLYLAHERLGNERIAELASALIAWSAGAGQPVFAALGHGALKTITENDWRALEPFVAEYDALARGGE